MYKLFTGNDLLRKSTRILWIDSQVHAQTLSKSTECRSVKAYDQHSNKHIYVYCCFCNDQCTRTDCEPTLNLSNRELRVSFEYDVLVFTNCASILENKNLDVTRHVDPHVFDDSSYKTQGFKHSAFYLHYSQQGFKTLNSIDRILGIVFMLMVLIASNFKVMYKWLGNNPGGLKLHNQTIEVVAYYCAYILKIWYSVIKLIFSYPVILVQCLSACSAITGICLF
ncbi:hypothetical protein GJ496_002718 [Pomphorhynchus laevis]|nr:hypothetical protein GJ496_002718 [Pomphorhynchus laevis]